MTRQEYLLRQLDGAKHNEVVLKKKTSRGAVVSRVAQAGLRQRLKGNLTAKVKNGVPVFPARPSEIVTLEHVQKIMDEEGI